MPGPASRLYAQNVLNVMLLMTRDGEFAPDFDDEIVAAMCVTHAGEETDGTMSEAVIWLTIFVLAAFVGVEVISKVSSTLHTPLMSGANAIHGVILVGAILVAGTADSTPILVLSLVAVVLAAINMVGGFVVTDRMLLMFRPRRPPSKALESDGAGAVTPVWAQLGYLVAAVCFILALKGLSSPKTARRGNLIGAAGAVLACVIVFAATDLDHLVPILVAIARRHRGRGARRLPGADDPDAPAGRPVQRRRRRRRGHRRPGRAGPDARTG